MRKKGFTLIELIVVIAILGVLMGILVPAVMGYVKKARIQAGNAAASQVARALNAVITEESEEDTFVKLTGLYGFNSDIGTALDTVTDVNDKSIADYMIDYSAEIENQDFAAYLKDGFAVGVACKKGKYYGTYPLILSNKNYDKLLPSPSYENALKLVVEDYK